MFCLKYINYDEFEIIAVSNEISKLEALKNELSEKYEKYHEASKIYSDNCQRIFQEFREINLAFWQKNKHAIENQKHSEGLWVHVKWNPPPIQPSGVIIASSPYFSLERVFPIRPEFEVIGNYSEKEIEAARQDTIQYLASCTDYSNIKYINWDLITDPIPVYYYDYENNKPPECDGYPKSSLIIEEVNLVL